MNDTEDEDEENFFYYEQQLNVTGWKNWITTKKNEKHLSKLFFQLLSTHTIAQE